MKILRKYLRRCFTNFFLKYINLILFIELFKINNILAAYKNVRSHQHFTQLQLDLLTRESYNEVSAFIFSSFNERCNLAMQNCLFQTQWEHIFSKERLYQKEIVFWKKKRDIDRSYSLDGSFKKRSTSLNSNFNASFHYCKAFLKRPNAQQVIKWKQKSFLIYSMFYS